MTKKPTSWITIAEDALHTPASKAVASAKSGSKPVKNKLFWGASFVVLVIVTFVLLAPQQFSSLMKGSLFDTTGIVPEEVVDMIEPESEVVEEVEEEDGPVFEEVVEEEPGNIFQSEPVVQPEEEAVTISIEPIEQPEEIEVEPIAEEEPEEVVETEVEVEEPDAEALLIEELNKQIMELQKQKELQNQALQDLTNIVQEELKKSAALEIPPAVTTTTTIGQPPALQPGFRMNTHTVSISPEQMLNQNLSGGYQPPAAAPIYQPSVQIQARGTPETGPSEILLIAFMITFMGLVSWKFIRVFA